MKKEIARLLMGVGVADDPKSIIVTFTRFSSAAPVRVARAAMEKAFEFPRPGERLSFMISGKLFSYLSCYTLVVLS
jgi:hypothetical protein